VNRESTFESFSVIVAAYNASATLTSCLESLRRLDPPATEIIIVDDASTDDTARLASAPDLQLVRLKTNLGPGLARNAGAAKARGDHLAFTDADCEVPSDWLLRLAEAFRDQDVCGVTGPYSGASSDRFLPNWIDRFLRHQQRDLPDRIESSITANLSVRRADFEAVGGFAEYYLPGQNKACFRNEDEELAFHLARRTGKPIYWHRRNGVRHAYRPDLAGFLRQQAGFTESIMISYARFPEMRAGRSNYGRVSPALSIVSLLVALAGAVGAPFSVHFLLLTFPFFLLELRGVLYLTRTASSRGDSLATLIVSFPLIGLIRLAWAFGLATGAVKAAIGRRHWRRLADARSRR
jgi:glycosyltransferase involved in cell wall biosynthesis